MRHKRGQSSTEGISILILLIGLFMLMYIILLPPAERMKLLNETASTYSGADGIVSEAVILSAAPGKVYSRSVSEHTINIEPMHVFSREESKSYNLVRSMTVSKNILKDNFKTVSFNLDDLADLQDVQLFFLITESKGPITIYLNDMLIFDGILTSSELPLELPLVNLQASNKLGFYSPSPGIKIFSSNYYLLQDIKLLKTFKVEKTKSIRNFYISEELGQQVKRASLYYMVTCNTVEQRPTLSISLNSRSIYEDTIFCDYLEERSLPLTKTVLNVYGKNRLEVEIDKGDINLAELKVEVELDKAMFPTYSFDISSSLWGRLEEGDSDLMLKMTFNKVNNRKRAGLFVQNEKINMNTLSLTYTRDITDMVDNGANVFKLEPLNDFEVVNIKIYEE